jgi:GntR family transcriptional regulator, phosphonate transport system regulatory protein
MTDGGSARRMPIWQAIAGTLREEIAGGRYQPGDRLPTEATLSQRFGVNRHTVRQGMAALISEGAVVSRRGAGVFVAARPTDYPIGQRVRFHQSILASGRTPSREIVHLETRRADRREAEALGLEDGSPVHVCEGVSRVDGVALAQFRSVFPAARFPQLLERLRETPSVTAALRAEGLADYTRAETRITAKIARGPRALLLGVRDGAPILRSVAVNVDSGGQPVEFGKTWFAGDRVTLVVAAEDLVPPARPAG